MNSNDLYKRLSAIQKMAWKHDDLMTQETLFELQDALADVVLNVARDAGKLDDCLATFPYLYSIHKTM